MNDRDIEDTRQPPEYPEIDYDGMWTQIWEYLPDDLGEFLRDVIDDLEQESTARYKAWKDLKGRLDRIVQLQKFGAPTQESVIAIAEGKR